MMKYIVFINALKRVNIGRTFIFGLFCCLGPDAVSPATCHWTTARDGCVKLDLDSESQPPLPPISVISMFKNTAMKSPDHTAMGECDVKVITALYSVVTVTVSLRGPTLDVRICRLQTSDSDV